MTGNNVFESLKNQARSVVTFSSTHKYIWSRNLSKLRVKIETFAKNFKLFWSLEVRTCVYAYRTLRA